MPEYDLKLLQHATDEALGAAQACAVDFSEPINWGNLSCAQAQCVEDDSGDVFYRVVIEEAAPECCELQRFVSSYLRGQGFEDVVVDTEW